MMTNLFSIFDPSTSIGLNMSWLSAIIPIIWISFKISPLNSPLSTSSNSMFLVLSKEMGPLITKKSSHHSIIFISTFFLILLSNIFGLLPYVFTSSSHMIFPISLSLSLYLGKLIYGWSKNPNNMFAHLVPSGTPFILMSFMVMIETISSLIRPLTLAVRLMANMTAGHLILCLISSLLPNTSLIFLMGVPIQLMILTLESAVAFIQAYVFTILVTLYSSEFK